MRMRKNTVTMMTDREKAISDVVAERGGYRSRSDLICDLVAEKARKLRIKRDCPEVLARMSAGTVEATDGQ